MSWLVLAATLMLAETDSQFSHSQTVRWAAQPATTQPPLANKDPVPGPAPGAPEGVPTPQPFGRVTPRIEPYEEERPPVEEEVAPEVEVEEVEPGISLNRIIGLEDCGISLFGTQLIDFSSVMRGGANPGHWADRNYFDLGLAIDTERFLSQRWTGGTFFFLFQSVRGSDGSVDSGDALVFDNIDLPESRGQLAEAFYEQWLWDARLRIKLGKIDANSEFVFNDFSGDFIHSGFGPQPTTFDVLPTYPDPSTAINLFFYPNEHLSLTFGIFDGRLVEGAPTGRRGLDFGGPYWMVGEASVSYDLGCRRDGRLAVGGWGHTFNAFERLDGSGTQDGQAGLYVYLDQVLWLESPCDEENEQGIRAFVSYGIGDDDVNTFPQAITAGLIWDGMLACRDDDIFGLGVAWGQFSDKDPTTDENAEVATELFYRLSMTPCFSVQPAVHYVVNPSGDSTLDDAWIGTMRLIAEF